MAYRPPYPLAKGGPSNYLTVPGADDNNNLGGRRRRPSFDRTLSNVSSTPSNLVRGASLGSLLAPPQADTKAPLPPDIQLAKYSFAGHTPRRFTYSGRLSAFDAMMNQRVRWDHVQPPTVDGTPDGRRLYRFNDIHCHMHNYTGAGHRISDAVEASIKLGIPRFTLMPIPTTLVSVYDDQQTYTMYGNSSHCGEGYYVPAEMAGMTNLSEKTLNKIQKKIELRVNPSVDTNLARQVADAVKYREIEPRHLDKMDLALTGIHLGDRRICKDILKTLHNMKETSDNLNREVHRQGRSMEGQRLRFSLIGEVTLRKEVVERLFAGKGQANLKSNIGATRDAMRLAGIIGMPWVLHCDVDKPESLKEPGEKNKRPMHIEDVKALMRSCPNTEIVWAHAGGLGRFVRESPNHLAELEALMRDPTLNHVKLDISWSVVAEQIMRDPAAMENWAQFMVRHEHRICFGSDTLTPQTNDKWTETFDVYGRGLFQRMDALSATASVNIRLRNYDRIIRDARTRIDCFTDYVLPEIIESVQSINGPDNIDLEALWKDRDKIYAQLAPTHPVVRNTLNYFANRDRLMGTEKSFPPVRPDKVRENQVLKGTINRLTFGKTMKNYKPDSGRSGDFRANNIRREEVRNLQAYVNEMGEAIRRLPVGVTAPANAFARIYQNMGWAVEHLDSNLPPDEILHNLRQDLTALRTQLGTDHGIVLPALPPPAG
jgi:hypothetical protein